MESQMELVPQTVREVVKLFFDEAFLLSLSQLLSLFKSWKPITCLPHLFLAVRSKHIWPTTPAAVMFMMLPIRPRMTADPRSSVGIHAPRFLSFPRRSSNWDKSCPLIYSFMHSLLLFELAQH